MIILINLTNFINQIRNFHNNYYIFIPKIHENMKKRAFFFTAIKA